MVIPDRLRLYQQAVVDVKLLLAITALTITLASAQCKSPTVAAKFGNVTLTNGEIGRAIPLAIGTPATEFAFLPQWYVCPPSLHGLYKYTNTANDRIPLQAGK